MSDRSSIEWTDATWNPVTGCTRVGPGCANCYAEAMTKRFRGDFRVRLHPDRLDQPLHWRKPRRIFVCSMSDLFHEWVPDDFLAMVFQRMATDFARHTFLVLTKRPERMRRFLDAKEGLGCVAEAFGVPYPFPNVWLGVSVENQRAADERIRLLLQTPAAVRFVSCEPLLTYLNLQEWLGQWTPEATAKLDWVIAGGESGSGARASQLWWFTELCWTCRAHRVPFFMKQLGSVLGREHGCRDRKGGDMEHWPTALRVREWPA